MQTQNVQVTLSGATLAEVVKQAIQFVGDAGTTTVQPKTATNKKASDSIPNVDDAALEMLMDDDDSTSDGGLDFDAEDTTPTTPKAKKYTDKDVNDAAMKHAKVNGKAETLKILNKKFKVKSIMELKASQYAQVIEALAV